mmetsp:Transcript_56155/g.125369  ORF Transcript_56155/g.125369 Transcript_56155/m.125369 type:complete len:104 (+) Transcript_56155:236-547(+)
MRNQWARHRGNPTGEYVSCRCDAVVVLVVVRRGIQWSRLLDDVAEHVCGMRALGADQRGNCAGCPMKRPISGFGQDDAQLLGQSTSGKPGEGEPGRSETEGDA